MKLTKESELLMSFFIDNKCVNHIKNPEKTDKIFIGLYNEINRANKYIESLKKKQGNLFYHLKIKEINVSSQIAKPVTFSPNSFPSKIRQHIDESIFTQISYSFHLLGRKIQIYFLLEDVNVESNIEQYNKYVDNMLIWLVIINEYASNKCATELSIYLYFTSLTKKVPTSNIYILDQHNVNTAFTTTCPKQSEIIVYRKEEWFKVFLHETFHTFGLDFSDMNNELCRIKILDIFPVNSEVNLYESYTEFWAKIMNALFCSYHNLTNKEDSDDFLNNCEFFINFEIIFSYFQMVKILDFMNLNYNQLYEKGPQNDIIRKSLYKEKTNILAYYIITLILLKDYTLFLNWCSKNNTSLLQFKKTIGNQTSFCTFIQSKYKTKLFLKNIQCVEKLIRKLKSSKNTKDINYIQKNLRMTICELG
jgi:hypothetical protein